ncbi:adenylate kinase [Synchytrium microbalum]|uniref:Adenylate kinase n=1 Tax=Synchytrium microbalum TaxID=1806994 RepID=A0A507BYZ5_9FUNG|nr:adenylate kinase [Synchytrium microbalum]TPX32338.1 adenylate kinase [Synchytrium microbalum]
MSSPATVIEQILKLSPNVQGQAISTRPAFILAGPPGSDTSAFAERFARDNFCEYLSPCHYMHKLITEKDNTDPLRNEVAGYLLSGQEVPNEVVLKCLDAAINSEEAKSRGFVLEGLSQLENDGDVLRRLIENSLAPTHTAILIELQMTREDSSVRLVNQYTDYETGVSYTVTQVEKSRAAIASRPVPKDGEGDEEAEEEAAADPEPVEDEIAEDEELDENGEPIRRYVKKQPPLIPLTVNGPELELLSQDILNRLVTNPQFSQQEVDKDWDSYEKFQIGLRSVYKTLGVMRTIKADASQHPDVLSNDVLDRLATVDWTLSHRAPPCIRIGDATLTGGLSMPEAKAKLEILDLVEGEAPRDWSDWRHFCPVAFSETDELVAGQVVITAVYKGSLYFFSTEERINKFIANPERYLATPPRLRAVKICILGGPMSGKTTQADLLSKLYSAKRINVDSILSSWDLNRDQAGLRSKIPVYDKIVVTCQKGQPVTTEQMVEVVQWAIAEESPTRNGWILDGFPYTIDQANALVAAGIKADFVVTLQSDAKDENVIARAAAKQIDWRTGLASKEISTDPTAIAAYPNLVDLYGSADVENHEITKILAEKSFSAPTDDVVSTCSFIRRLIDPFVPQAVVAAEPIPEFAIMGPSKDYCPVRLAKDKVLVRGNRNFGVKWQSLYFYCSTSQAQKEFLANPVLFAFAPCTTPPPRIVFMGARGSGKNTVASELLSPFKVPIVSMSDLINEYMQSQTEESKARITEQGDPQVALPTATVIELVRNLFTSEPHQSQGFGLKGFPRNKADTEALFAAGLYPDAFVHLRIDAETSAQRMVNARRGEPIMSADDEAAWRDELVASADNELASIADSVATIEPYNVLVIDTDGGRPLRPLLATLRNELRTFLECRSSLLTNVVPLDSVIAEGFLSAGLKSFSPYGQYCPVTMTKSRIVTAQIFGKMPAMTGDYVYYLADESALQEFSINAQKYISSPPIKPAVRPIISVIGRPKSGKTALSRRLAGDLGMTYVDIPAAVSSLLEDNRQPLLALKIKDILLSGQSVPSDLAAQAIVRVLSRISCQSHGVVLDNFPSSVKEAELLEKCGLVPQTFFEMNVSESEMMNRTRADYDVEVSQEPFAGASVPGIVKAQDAVNQSNMSELRQWVANSYHGWEIMDGARSKWALATDATKTIERAIERRQVYLLGIYNHRAVSVDASGIDSKHMDTHMGVFGDFCPVCLVDRDELVPGSHGTSNMAEYEGYYYRMAGADELGAFLKDPTRYTESGKTLPASLPVRRSIAEVRNQFPKQVELQGYCPVTLTEGPTGPASVVPGESAYTVEWNSKLYQMANESQTLKFIKSPWRYTSATLPAVLPPRKVQIPVTSLPLVGYLEHTVSTALTDALGAVGKLRPKYPFKSMSKSANQYMGLYLKAHNPKSKAWVLERQMKKLKVFEGECALVEQVRGGVTESYKDASGEVEVKLDKFFGLRNHSAAM